MKKLLLPLFAVALLAGCDKKAEEPVKPAAVSYIDKIKARDKLIVGVFTDKPPFGFVDEAGRYVGFDTDIGRQFAKDLLGDENKVEFVAVEPASRIPFLQSDKVDLILANMTVTPERKEAVDFTNPNLKVAVQALVPNDSAVKSLNDLATRITIVTTGTPAVIEQIKAQLGRLVPVHQVNDLTVEGPSVARELALIKVAGTGDKRVEAMRLADVFRARVVDTTLESFVFEITGAPEKVDAFIELMRPLGVIEVARTGVAAIARGGHV